MGCVLSSIDEDERVGICKERKKVIRQLVCNREEFLDSLLAYLEALRNTGATLRQFTEFDTLELDFATLGPHVADYQSLSIKYFDKDKFVTLQGENNQSPQ